MNHKHNWEQDSYREIIDRFYYSCTECHQRRAFSGRDSRVIANAEKSRILQKIKQSDLSDQIKNYITELAGTP